MEHHNNLGPRLHLARRKAGLSLRRLAELSGNVVSHETLRQMENGEKVPDPNTLDALCLALNVDRASLMDPLKVSLGEIEFRKVSRTSAADRQAVREEILDLLERYIEVEDILGLEQWTTPLLDVTCPNDDDNYPEEMAQALRKEWKLGLEPIDDLTRLLEDKGLKVLFPQTPVNIAGLTCEVRRPGRSSVFVVVANREHSVERWRLTLAYELGHRVLDLEDLNGKMAESVCNRFAGAFLLPKETLERELGSEQRVPIYRELMTAKRFFRVSAATLVLRLKQAGLMDVSQRDRLLKTMGQSWRTVEPEPLEEKSEAHMGPQRFERLVYRALGMGFISAEKAAELLLIPIHEVKRNIEGD